LGAFTRTSAGKLLVEVLSKSRGAGHKLGALLKGFVLVEGLFSSRSSLAAGVGAGLWLRGLWHGLGGSPAPAGAAALAGCVVLDTRCAPREAECPQAAWSVQQQAASGSAAAEVICFNAVLLF